MALLEWLAKLGLNNLDALKVIIQLFQSLAAAETNREKVKIAIELIEAIAKLSPTSVDDDILRVIRQIASDALIDQIIALLERFGVLDDSSISAVENYSIASLEDRYQAEGLNLMQIIALVRMVKQILDMVRPSSVS